MAVAIKVANFEDYLAATQQSRVSLQAWEDATKCAVCGADVTHYKVLGIRAGEFISLCKKCAAKRSGV